MRTSSWHLRVEFVRICREGALYKQHGSGRLLDYPTTVVFWPKTLPMGVLAQFEVEVGALTGSRQTSCRCQGRCPWRPKDYNSQMVDCISNRPRPYDLYTDLLFAESWQFLSLEGGSNSMLAFKQLLTEVHNSMLMWASIGLLINYLSSSYSRSLWKRQAYWALVGPGEVQNFCP